MTPLMTKCGTTFYVDEENEDACKRHSWSLDKNGYVSRKTTLPGRKCVTIFLHRFVFGASENQIIDHINHDKLNNTKENLRLASRKENARNQEKTRGVSRFKGVVFVKKSNKWQAQIGVSTGRHKYLGTFYEENIAAHEYNKAAIAMYGEFACLNPVGD